MENASSIFARNAEQSLRFFRAEPALRGGTFESIRRGCKGNVAMPGRFIPIYSVREAHSALCAIPGLSEQLSCDHDFLYLIRSLIDLSNLGISHHSFKREVRHVAISPCDLEGIGGHLHGDV